MSAAVPQRLFLAVWPPEDVRAVLDGLPMPGEPGVRWVSPELRHVTLRFLGRATVEEVVAALDGVELPPATAECGPAVSRLGRFVVVVPVAGLGGLASAVVTATAAVGEPPDPRPFHGHLTLARLKHRGACGIAGAPVRASFPVTEVSLVSSRLGSDGPTYTVVHRFPVGPAAPGGGQASAIR